LDKCTLIAYFISSRIRSLSSRNVTIQPVTILRRATPIALLQERCKLRRPIDFARLTPEIFLSSLKSVFQPAIPDYSWPEENRRLGGGWHFSLVRLRHR
jgi:hypothetical protein